MRSVIMECLENIQLFKELNSLDLEVVASHMNLLRLSKGDTVFKEGAIGNFVCFVIDGNLDVIKKTSSYQKKIVIASLSRGDSIGEMSVIDEFSRSATVKAKSEATLVKLTRERFNYILETDAQIGIKFLMGISRMLSLHLRVTSERLADVMPSIFLY